ncbi:unnamed protein product, partial [marine sediment metagenome]
MGALQYCDIPNYSAIIFRRQIVDLEQQGALISRAHEWLHDTPARWSASNNRWHFPSGAVLAFGHLSSELIKYNYQGAEFQYIAFDELTQFWEEDYLYLRSRLRKPTCPDHRFYCDACKIYHTPEEVDLLGTRTCAVCT